MGERIWFSRRKRQAKSNQYKVDTINKTFDYIMEDTEDEVSENKTDKKRV